LKKSLPHIVFVGLGAMDQLLKGYTDKSFVEVYSSFIQEIQNLPTKPSIFLLTPVFGCRQNIRAMPHMSSIEPIAAKYFIDDGHCKEQHSSD